MGLLAEKYHQLPSEMIDPDEELSPIARLMLDSAVSARTDRWLKKQLEKRQEAPVSVTEQIKAEWKEWQKFR